MATGQGAPGGRDDLIGRTIDGRYRVVERIGTGAMAAIYRAELEDRTSVALKILPPEIARHKTASARFHREARAAARLEHPGIVRVLGWGVDGETPYIAMELLEGIDLFEVLRSARRLEVGRALRLAIHLCDALAAAHDAGIVHRDLKPENIMLIGAKSEQRVKVLDFGIAKLVDRGERFDEETIPQVLTKVGSAVGTPSHMAPEQARGDPVDGRADLYALGVLLYEMLTGHLPFEGSNPLLVAVSQVRDPPPPPSRYLPSLDPELERIILVCLEKSPRRRFASARELAAALAERLKQLEAASSRGPEEHETAETTYDEDELPTRQRAAVGPRPAAKDDLDDETTPSLEGPTLRHVRSALIRPPRARQGTEIMQDVVQEPAEASAPAPLPSPAPRLPSTGAPRGASRDVDPQLDRQLDPLADHGSSPWVRRGEDARDELGRILRAMPRRRRRWPWLLLALGLAGALGAAVWRFGLWGLV